MKMASFKAYFKKEVLESIRQSRYIIFLAGFGIWSILNPLTLKFLPNLIGDQLPQELLDLMIPDRIGAIQNFISDIFSLVILFVIFPLMGILADEVGRQRLMLPSSKGMEVPGMVLAKSLHYNLVICIMVLMGFSINFYYTGILFGDGGVTFAHMLGSAIMVMLYFVFVISLLLFVSSLVRKGIIAGLIVLVSSYFMPVLLNIGSIKEYLPYYLVQRAGDISNVFDGTTLPAIVVTLLLIVSLNALSIWRMKQVEVV